MKKFQKRKEKKAISQRDETQLINYWTKEEDKILLAKAKEFEYRNWKEVSKFIPGKTDVQCSARYKRIKPGIIKGPWSKEEDEELLEYIRTIGTNWSLISKYIPSRTGKQIRDRYLNALDPNVNRGKFTEEEDDKIIELYKQYGPAWSKISSQIIGRTGDMIKNRFYSTLKKNINNKQVKSKEKKNKINKIEKKNSNQLTESTTDAENFLCRKTSLDNFISNQNILKDSNKMAFLNLQINNLVDQIKIQNFCENVEKKSLENHIGKLKELLNYSNMKLDFYKNQCVDEGDNMLLKSSDNILKTLNNNIINEVGKVPFFGNDLRLSIIQK